SKLDPASDAKVLSCRQEFLAHLERAMQDKSGGYIETIQGLPADVSASGTKWLECVAANYCKLASAALPGLQLFKVQGFPK
ncbi:MAG TPA: hypothetical protein PLF54_09785, partial [Deltaproteobacteria bacterium]|nr:hypothetical protein [Deltaproteobacteria bacterium]